MAITGTLSLVVELTDGLTNQDYGLTFTQTLSGYIAADKRKVLIPTGSTVNVFTVGAAVGAGQFVDPDIMIFINRDSTNNIILGFIDTGGDTVYVRVDAGEMFIMGNTLIDANVAGAAFAAYFDFDTVTASSLVAACYLEYLVLSN